MVDYDGKYLHRSDRTHGEILNDISDNHANYLKNLKRYSEAGTQYGRDSYSLANADSLPKADSLTDSLPKSLTDSLPKSLPQNLIDRLSFAEACYIRDLSS